MSSLWSSLTSLAVFTVACLCLCSSSLMPFFRAAFCIREVYQICSMLDLLLAALTYSQDVTMVLYSKQIASSGLCIPELLWKA